MFLFKLTIVAVVAVVSTQADQTWYNFKTTFAPHLGGKNDQPRTIDEAEKAGWLVVSDDCSEGARCVYLYFMKRWTAFKSGFQKIPLRSDTRYYPIKINVCNIIFTQIYSSTKSGVRRSFY